MGKTKIEWATHTNNWLAGCSKVSRACQHCYAETMSVRIARGLGGEKRPARYLDGVVDVDRGRWTGRVSYDRAALDALFSSLRNAKTPRRVFCNSMSDTFHEDAPRESLVDLAAMIGARDTRLGVPPHVIMLLTKRPARAVEWQREFFPDGLPFWVWVGTTIEGDTEAARLLDLMRLRTYGVRFVSAEPLVGSLDLTSIAAPLDGFPGAVNALTGIWWPALGDADQEWDGRLPYGAGPIGWVIAGGESGAKAEPSHPDWFRGLRDQCADAAVPFFFKQWGEYGPEPTVNLSTGARGQGFRIFPTFERWVQKASSWIDESYACLDAKGRRCRVGADFMRADDEGSFPVVAMPRVGKHAAGAQLDGVEHKEVPGV